MMPPTNDPAARRSTLMMAGGALVGLLIAGYGLFTAKGTVVHRVPPEDAALVNQHPILMSDLIAQAESTYSAPFDAVTQAQRRTILAAMIHEELYVQRGLELDFPGTDPETRNALVAAVEQQAVADATTELPTDRALERYYQAHKTSYATEGTMWVEDFRVDDEAAARRAVEALRKGAPSAWVMHEPGVTPGPQRGEDFYFAAKIHLGDALFAVAQPMADGAVSDPVTIAGGIHVLRMIKNMPPVARDFAHAREQVLGDYKREAAAKLRTADEKYLYGKADIQVAESLR
jgi:parvulin-like peptidyl-prolyl isomerase